MSEPKIERRRVFVDMDGVIVDFDAYARAMDQPGDEVKKRAGAYLRMKPIPGAIEAVRSLMGMGFDVWLASKPPTGIAFAYGDKAQWVFDNLPELKRKLILTHDKGLLGCENDILIDDRPHKANCDKFRGKLIHFTNNWPEVIDCIQSEHAPSSPAAPTPHANAKEFRKTYTGDPLVIGNAMDQDAVYRFAEALAASETARADRAEQQSKVGLEAEAKDCLKALCALSGAKYPTPVEGYGTNSSWAISDLCRAVHEKEADLQRKDAALQTLIAAAEDLLRFVTNPQNIPANNLRHHIEKLRAIAAPTPQQSDTPDAFQSAWQKYNAKGIAGGWEKVGFTSGFGAGWKAALESRAEVTPSPCCANPNLVVKGRCDTDHVLHLEDECVPIFNWRPTHNVCLSCGKEEAL